MKRLFITALLAAALFGCTAYASGAEPTPDKRQQVEERYAAMVLEAELTDPEQQFTQQEISMLGALLENESINLPGDEAIYPLWCVMNRVDDATGRFPGTVYGVLTQSGQFLSAYWEPRESTRAVVVEQLTVYLRWRYGYDQERPMPEGLVFYCGCGSYNLFRTDYRGGSYWANGSWR